MAIFTAIGTAVAGALFAGSAIAASLIAGGLALATSLAVSYLTRPKKRKYGAVQGEVEFGGDVPVSAAYGWVATFGHCIYYAKYGEGNKYNARVYILSNGWCDGLEDRVFLYGNAYSLIPIGGRRWTDPDNGNSLEFVNAYKDDYSPWSGVNSEEGAAAAVSGVFGEALGWSNFNTLVETKGAASNGEGHGILGLIQGNVTGGPNGAFGNADEVWHVEGHDGKLVIRFFAGRPDQDVDEALVANTAGLSNKWSDDNRMRGLCYVVVEGEWDEDKFKNGWPDIKFTLRGLREYDPRYDSTVVGGDGPQRLNDPSTWEWTENPAVHRLNYQLGLRGLISDRVMIGEGKSMGHLDLGSYFTAMNVCDEVVGDEARYACSLIVNAEDEHTEVLKEFDDAMAGFGMNRRGLSGVIAGAAQVPVLTITEDDIRLDEPIELKRRKSAFDLYNYISGQFTSPDAGWEPESLTPVTSNLDVAADGRVRQVSNDFLQVVYPDTAQRLLTIRYRQNRKGGSISLPVSRRVGFAVNEGEWVNYDSKAWLITGWRCDSEFRVTLELAETGADVYSDEGIDPGPIVVPPPVLINPSMLMTVQNFSVDVGLITNDDGEDHPALKFTWNPPNDPTITQVRFEYKINDGLGGDSVSTVLTDVSNDPESGEFYTTKGVVGGKVYVARATITTVPDRLKSYTPWVSTPDYTARASVRAYLQDFGSDAYALLQQAYEKMEDLEARVEVLALAASDTAGEQIDERSVAVRYRNATAVALSEMSASVDEVDGNLVAQAEILDYVQAKIGDAEAGALWRMVTTVEDEGDVVSQIDFQTRAAVEDTFASAGMLMRAGFEGGNPAAPFSDIVLRADRVIVVNDSDENEVAPFAIVSGQVYINSAMIGELSADKLTAGTLTLQKWAPPTAGDNVILRLGAEDREYACFLTDYVDGEDPPFIVGDVGAVSARDGWLFVDQFDNINNILYRSFFAVGFDVLISGTISLQFDLERSGSGTARARVLKNGSQIDSISTTSSTSFDEDISVAAGDNITIQQYIDGGSVNAHSIISNAVVCSGNMTPAVQ